MYNEVHKRLVKLDEDEENTKENLITIYEKVTLETAGKIWECAIILGRYLMKQAYFDKIDLKEKRILELGCGTGILSIMLAKQGAKLWATDLPQVETLCEQNIAKNQVNDRVKFKLLDWNQSKHKTECSLDQQNFDYIVASDPIYNEKTLDSFFNQLQILYSIMNPQMYLAYKQRHEEIDKQIEDRLEQAGLWFKKIENSQLDELWKSAQCVIYKIGKF